MEIFTNQIRPHLFYRNLQTVLPIYMDKFLYSNGISKISVISHFSVDYRSVKFYSTGLKNRLIANVASIKNLKFYV
jgi:hypothetical protein